MLMHFLFSKIGLMFSSPFGFASSIWPATGVSLGLYLLYGRPVLVGMYLGYLLAIYNGSMAIDWATWSLPLGLGLCSVLQVAFAKWIIYKFIELPVETASLKKIIKFLFLVGPISSLLASFLGANLIYFGNELTVQELTYSWAIWWVGDATGVVFFTPLILFLKKNKILEIPAQPIKIVISNLIVFCFISIMFSFSSSRYVVENKQDFVEKVTVLSQQFENAQQSIKHQLRALSALLQTSENISRKDFEAFSKKVRNSDIKLRASAWIPYVTKDQRAQFENNVRLEGYDNFSIKYLAADGFKSSPEANFYFPILYTEPLALNEAAIGLDLNAHPNVKGIVQMAIATDDFIVTPTLPLVQQQDKYTGVIAYYPVFRSGRLESSTSPMSQLVGLVEVVFELDVLLQNLPAAKQNDFAFSFNYGSGNNYQSAGYTTDSIFSHEVTVDVFDKKGSLHFASLPALEDKLIDWTSWFVVVGGTLIGVVSVIFLYSLTSFSANLALQVEKQTKDLRLTNQKLEDANLAKTMFLANMSHEYRTPLNAIIGFTEIAKRETSDVNALKYLNKIEISSNSMLSIVNDVLDISKIQTNEFELDNDTFLPYKSLEQAADMLRESALNKGLQYIVDIEDIKHVWVIGDDVRFRQIIINLLSNAIKFTSEGFVKVKATAVMKTSDSCEFLVSVVDSGAGIPSDKLQSIFKPFQQAENDTNRRFGGTGLGLSIVNELCQLMSGNIELNSTLGKGTEFNITLMFSLSKEGPDQLDKVTPVVDNIGLVGTNVLIVEDNIVNQEVAKIQVQSLGANAIIRSNGEECLAYLKTEIPDIILMDLQMPVMDGFMTSKAIKNNPDTALIPIVILSASVTREDKLKAQSLGITSYLTKPFVQNELLAVLNDNLTIESV